MTRNFDARNEETREAGQNEHIFSDVFEENNLLEIPANTQRKFDNEGMSLRWIRISLKGKEDYQNVGKRIAEGWTFVSAEEVPEMIHSSFVQGNESRYEGAVCRGDLALAKMSKNRAESRKQFYEQKSHDAVEAVDRQLMSQSDSRLPITNSSKTKVIKGRAANFDE